MPNERLRAALLERGITPAELSGELGVDHKTVERWIGGRLPYRKHRYAVAARLGVDEAYLWPDALSREQVTAASESEVLAVYPHRSDVPREAWERLFSAAEREIGVLVYAGLFLAEDPAVQRILADKARAGVRVRMLLGDPDSPQVADRGADEGVDDAMAAKIQQRAGAVPGAARDRGRGVPVPSDDLVQLDLPRRRPATGEHAHLRGARRMRRCGTCGRSRAARSRRPTWRASSGSGRPPSRCRGERPMGRGSTTTTTRTPRRRTGSSPRSTSRSPTTPVRSC